MYRLRDAKLRLIKKLAGEEDREEFTDDNDHPTQSPKLDAMFELVSSQIESNECRLWPRHSVYRQFPQRCKERRGKAYRNLAQHTIDEGSFQDEIYNPSGQGDGSRLPFQDTSQYPPFRPLTGKLRTPD